MKIAEVVAVFPPYPGGTGYACLHNARELARRGHEVTVFTADYKRLPYKDDPEDFKIVRLKTPFIHGGGALVPQLYSRLKNFDIIHLHYPFFGGAEYVYFSSFVRGQKYFLTYHMDVFGDTHLKKLIIRAYEPILMKRILQRASAIGALSIEHFQSTKASHLVDSNRVVEMPNGVDIAIFAPRVKDEEIIEKYNLRNKVVILFVGHLIPLKGLSLLIGAISKLRDDNVVLLIVGEGYAAGIYKKLVAELGMQDRVYFIRGSLSHDRDMPRYFNTCDFLVLPSTLSEAFPLVVVEAMASGKPVIVSSLPGPSHLIEEGKEGLIAKVGDSDDLKDKIECLLHNKMIRHAMGLAAREKVIGKYSLDKIGERLESVLKEIIEK